MRTKTFSRLVCFVVLLASPRANGDQFTEYLNGRGIYAIIYDAKRSVVWFGTANDGLLKFDGNSFTTYNFPAKNPTIYRIEALAFDHDGNLWVGTSSLGAALFKIDENIWEIYNADSGLAHNHVRSIAVDDSGGVWFGTDGGAGFFGWKDGERQWYRYKMDKYERWDGKQWILETKCGVGKKYLSNDVVLAIAIDSAKVWFGTQSDISVRKSECEWATLSVGQRLVLSVVVDRQRRKWFGTDEGLYKLEADDVTFKYQHPDSLPRDCGFLKGQINASFVDYEGNLWFGTNTGVARFDPNSQTWRCTTGNSDFDLKPVACIAADEDGDMWFGSKSTPTRAIKYAANWFSFSSANDLKKLSNSVISMAGDQFGQIWLGTLHGLGRYNNTGWRSYFYINNEPNTINSIAVAKDTTLWLGVTANSGAYAVHIKPDGSSQESFPIEREIVFSIALAGDSVWFGTNRGLRSRNLTNRIWRTFTRASTSGGLINDQINALAVDGRGRLWCGTPAGVSCYDGFAWRSFTTADGLVNNEISAITVDHDNSLVWFATPGGAANVDTNYNFNKITTADGLVDNFVRDVDIFSTPGQKGYQEIWFATASGVSCRNAVGEWITYTEKDGLADNKVTVTQPGRKANEIWFGTNTDGVTRYRRYDKEPDTRILNPIDVVTQPEVIYRFAGNDLNTSRGFLRYSFKLDNANWSEYTFSTLVRIPVVKNGPHVFYVKAIDLDTNEDLTPAADSFYKIDPAAGGYTVYTDKISIDGRQDSVKITFYWPPRQLPDTAKVTIARVPDDSTNKNSITLAYDLLPYNLNISTKGVLLVFEFPQFIFASNQQYSVYRDSDLQDEQPGNFLGGTINIEHGRVKITAAINQLGRYVVREGSVPVAASAAMNVTAQPRIFSPRGGGHGPQTNIFFQLTANSTVKIKVYNLAGRLVNTILDRPMTAGVNVAVWDGRDYNGSICSTGLYIILIESDALTAQKKVMVLNE